MTSFQRANTSFPGDSVNPTPSLDQINYAYNALGQLTSQWSSAAPDQSGMHLGAMGPQIVYNYPTSTPNDGRLASRVDYYLPVGANPPFSQPGTAATTSYTYDSLGRLVTAQSSSTLTAMNWGQAFVYDPFGNLLQQNVTSGSAPTMNLTVDPTTNRISTAGFGYDAAGDLIQAPTASGTATYTYDSEGRLSGNGTIYYDTAGRRLFDGTNWYFYGPDGTQFASLYPTYWTPDLGYASVSFQARFAGQLVYDQGNPVVADRLGSVVQTSQGSSGVGENAFFPYGWTSSSFNPGTTSFATYRASGDFLYAQHRYYDANRGRFTSPDPSGRSMSLRNPLSFNRYAYVLDDPTNKNDPSGLDDVDVDDPGGSIDGAGGGGGGSTAAPAPGCDCNNNGGAVPAVTSLITLPSTPDIPLNQNAQTVGALLNQYNPGGFINAVGQIEAGAYLTAWYGAESVVVEIASVQGTGSETTAGGNASGILMPNGSPIGSPGNTPGIQVMPGTTLQDAQELFQQLAQNGTTVNNTYPGTMVQLPDGGIVGIRTQMTDSPGTIATIDINIPNIPISKIKVNPGSR